jgi:hypothetical protein
MATRDLEQTAANLVSELVHYECMDKAIDLDALRYAINERTHEAADSACTYWSDCRDIISQYENDPRADCDSADDMGTTYKPSEYREAEQAYAFWIAWSIIQAEANAVVNAIDEAMTELWNELDVLDVDVLDVDYKSEDDFRLTSDCPHGWAAHDRETKYGTCLWVSRQLDGCNAVAIPVAGMWVSYTWTPVAMKPEGEEG